MCLPLPSAEALDRFFSTTTTGNNNNNNNNTVHCSCCGPLHRLRHSLLRCRRRRPLSSSSSSSASCGGGGRSSQHTHQCRRRFAPYPPSSASPLDQVTSSSSSGPRHYYSSSGPMFKQGFPADVSLMAAGSDPMMASSVPLPPPPPGGTAAFNLQFNQKPSSSTATGGFSDFASEHHNHYQHQFPYTFSYASPPTYSWANTNSTNIMKFTGSSNPQPLDTSTYHISNFGSVPPVSKRKIDLDCEIPQPPKMRITEEKVSASLRDMHISNEFKSHDYCLPNTDVSDMDMMEDPSSSKVFSASDNIAKTESQQATLVMCEELRKLNKIDSIIPQPLLNVERPTNAVVVWKPQPVVKYGRHFTDFPKEPESTVVITEITDEEERAMRNNEDEMFIEVDNTIAVEDDEMEL